ncbi:2-phospho-L-lactate guanylyltransferase [uncultured Modestobacter sp.]|uniref:2-phospho-L-lactate guanylyltransferase n=1 Tax=uncultured Modestobacter sp. TaxID=380048 RepID=UPI002623BFD5|nr:2-phospho-L-lactate guanylyltransferase [uncultured Modestobacter sp.]
MTGWSVVVPLKRLTQAKTRLSALPVPLRQALVVAMARDVRDAVLSCRDVKEVVIVTRDPLWRSLMGVRGLRFVAEAPTDSLNDALRRGSAACRGASRGWAVAALTADLPALTPAELHLALAHVDVAPTFFVPDAQGDGTTLVAARSHAEFRPLYGVGSRARHLEAGALEVLRPELTGLRQDVDTVEDLALARTLRLGERTRVVVSHLLPEKVGRAGNCHARRRTHPRADE